VNHWGQWDPLCALLPAHAAVGVFPMHDDANL
jgi:hypothetical protein